jgi:CRISPR-associated RAMP protein (TIGR02581 family)
MLYDTFDNRVILTTRLRAETALRVGTGRALDPVRSDLPVIKDAIGRPFIPGSSLKGVLRSRVESFVRAVRPGRKGACNPTLDSEWCIRPGEQQPVGWRYPAGGVPADQPVGVNDLRKGLEDLPAGERDAELGRRVLSEACLVCQVFGSPWLASRVQFRDLSVDPDLWFGQFQERDGVAIDRDTETASERKLYSFEVVPASTEFIGQIVIENAQAWQLGLLSVGLRELREGRLALGGATSRGLGVASLDWTGFQVRRDRLLDYLAGDPAARETISDEIVMDWGRQFVAKLRGEG